MATNKADYSATAPTVLGDVGGAVNCNDSSATPNNGTVHKTDDNVVTMSRDELTKEVLYLRESVRQLKQKMEFLLSFVGITDVQDTGHTTHSEAAQSSANAAVLTRATETATINEKSIDHSTQRPGSDVDVDAAQVLTTATAVRISGPFRQAVLSAVYADQEAQRGALEIL